MKSDYMTYSDVCVLESIDHNCDMFLPVFILCIFPMVERLPRDCNNAQDFERQPKDRIIGSSTVFGDLRDGICRLGRHHGGHDSSCFWKLKGILKRLYVMLCTMYHCTGWNRWNSIVIEANLVYHWNCVQNSCSERSWERNVIEPPIICIGVL